MLSFVKLRLRIADEVGIFFGYAARALVNLRRKELVPENIFCGRNLFDRPISRLSRC